MLGGVGGGDGGAADVRGGRRLGTTIRCVTRGVAASAAAVAPASTERPSMGVYELARAAASRCAARIEELPVFRLAWSERGAPRRGLPVFRLAWSERGAPRRSCAAGGAPGAPGVCMRRRPAGRCRRDIAYAHKECSRGSGAARCALRGQRVPKFAPNQESQPPQSVLIFRRVNSDSRWKAFVQTPQDSLGWVGRFKNVNFYAVRRWNSLLAPRSSKGRYRSPTGPLVAYGKERCAPAAPREERGPGAPLAASAARSWPRGLQTHAFPDEGDLRRRGHGTTSRRRQKPEFPQTDFCQSRCL